MNDQNCTCCSCENLPGRPATVPVGTHCPDRCVCWIEQRASRGDR